MTLTPWVFQSTCPRLSLLLIAITCPMRPRLDMVAHSEKGVPDEARCPRPDLELLFSCRRRSRAWLFHGGRARRFARAGLPGRPGLSRDARPRHRFRRRLGAFGVGRL